MAIFPGKILDGIWSAAMKEADNAESAGTQLSPDLKRCNVREKGGRWRLSEQ
jgi:hypothetical protein